MLIIQIALGILLGFFLIAFLVSEEAKVIILVAITVIVIYFILAFIFEKLEAPARKRNYEESWKRFNEQRRK
jgi:uncharacterized membrane protein YfcA